MRAYINLVDQATNSNAAFGSLDEKIELGRQIFFRFDYPGNDEFKELFENEFLVKYFDNDVYCDDIQKFKRRLRYDVLAKIPLFYNEWATVSNELDELLKNSSYKDVVSENAHGTSSGTSSNSGTSKNKTLGSNMPNDIARAGALSDVGFMNSGSMSESESATNSQAQNTDDRTTYRTVEHNDNGGVVSKINELNESRMLIIERAVNSFNNLFMLVW